MSINNNVSCSVSDCKFHSGQNVCTLDHINISRNTAKTKSCTCTDCASYQPKV